MPYGRSSKGRFKRKPIGKPRGALSWYNRKYSPMDMAKKAWSAAKYVKSLINVEHMKSDITTTTVASTTPVVVHVTAIAEGDDEGSRTGRSILLKYLYLKQTCTLNVSANYDQVRLVVVRDNQQIADTAPAYTDVYETVSPISLLKKAAVGRFDILYDRLMNLDARNPSYTFDHYISLNSHCRYNGAASTDQQKGAIYIMYVGTQATNTAGFGQNARLSYIDN